ncbi:MAG: ion channel [Acetobacteraceae bacterium]
MTGSGNARRFFRLSPSERLGRALRVAQRRLRLDLWFPQSPLFLAVLILGLLLVRHAHRAELFVHFSPRNFATLSASTLASVIHGAPSAVIGAFLIVMSVGLLRRSRLAWVIALISAAASFLLIALTWPGGVHSHPRLVTYDGLILLLLLLFSTRFNRSSLASATLFAIISSASLLAYAVLGTFLLGASFAPPVKDLVTALYFAIVTMGTVGFGDIVPKTNEARLFTISVIVLGITVFATSLSALLLPLINRRAEELFQGKEKRRVRSNHYIVVSDSALARNTRRELKARNLPFTALFAQAPDGATPPHDLLLGDPTDLDVLREAGAAEAKAVLALGMDDSENAFVVMAARELSESVQTVAAVNDARNMERIKRVRPSLIIAPQVLGGTLLAMALSGEKMEDAQLVEQLLHYST